MKTSAAFTRIRFRILLIVLLAVIPAVALIYYSAADRERQMSTEIEGNTLRLSRFLASNLERDLSEGEGYLRAVAELLREKRLLDGNCSDALAMLMHGNSVYSNLGLAGPDGKILCSSRRAPADGGLGALEWFHKLDSTSGHAVGFDFNGGLGTEASIVLVLPVAGSVEAGRSGRQFLFSIMDLSWLNRLAESSRLPPGSAISVTNRHGDAIARYPDPDKWVGKSRQSPKELERMTEPEGTLVTAGIDSIRRLYAYAKVAGKGGLVVNVGVAREALLEPAKQALRRQLTALGLVALLAILAAWFGADLFLLKQIRLLIEATKKLGAGNLQARSSLSYDNGELGELARAFDEMAETLEWRNAQLRESERERSDPIAQLSEFIECVPEPFLVMDGSHSIVASNSEAAALLGLRQEEFINKGVRDIFPDFPIDGEASPLSGVSGKVARSRYGARGADPEAPAFECDISLAGFLLAKKPYLFAIVRKTPEPARNPS